VNPRARRISIRIDARAGEAVAIAPSERRLSEAVAFARSKAGWIAERLEARVEGRPLEPGQIILLHGLETRLEATGTNGAARLTADGVGPVIRSGGEGEAFARRVENLLKREARAQLVARTDVHLKALNQRPVKVSVVDTRSRWGSCSPHNRSIRYSWRMVMAPPAVLDYLAAHEVAHLVHADHSPGLLVGGASAGRGSPAVPRLAEGLTGRPCTRWGASGLLAQQNPAIGIDRSPAGSPGCRRRRR
jgi:predicted metal-dependent hydrolase